LSDDARAAIALFLGLALLGSGILFRLGGLRYQAARYWDLKVPGIIRNMPFVQGFGGAVFVSIGLLVYPPAQSLTALAVLGMWTCGVAAIVFVGRPPQWLKPDWVVQEEQRRGVPSLSRLEASVWWIVAAVAAATLIFVISLLLLTT
jgi:hypothetical protein